MTTAKDTLDDLSQDPAAHRLARERADAKKLYRLDLLASEARGQAKVLLKLLTLRFGTLPESTRARIESATIKQLDAWAERVLTAPTLDDVLAP
ncbi:MAG: DUF4351 domain-containing protein [Nannocystaceae bacterium]